MSWIVSAPRTRLGQPLALRVEQAPSPRFVCRIGWRSRGRGLPEEQTVVERELGLGLSELPLPEGPAPFTGRQLRLEWWLRLETADGPAHEQPLEVEAPGGRTPDGWWSQLPLPPAPEPERAASASSQQFLMIWLGTGAGMVTLVWWALAHHLAWVAGVALAAVCTAVAWRTMRAFFRERPLGTVRIGLSRQRLAPGEELRCDVELRPLGRVELKRALVTLRCEELVISGHQELRQEHRQTLFQETRSLEAERDQSGALRMSTVLRPPQDTTLSFQGPHHLLRWSVDVALEGNSGRAVQRVIPLLVVPPALTASAADGTT